MKMRNGHPTAGQSKTTVASSGAGQGRVDSRSDHALPSYASRLICPWPTVDGIPSALKKKKANNTLDIKSILPEAGPHRKSWMKIPSMYMKRFSLRAFENLHLMRHRVAHSLNFP